jgi:hypothetical protein
MQVSVREFQRLKILLYFQVVEHREERGGVERGGNKVV